MLALGAVPTDSHEKWISRSRFFFQFKELMAKGAEIGVANMFRFVFLFFGGGKTVFFVVGELGNLIPNLSFCEKTIHPKFCIMYRDSAIYV